MVKKERHVRRIAAVILIGAALFFAWQAHRARERRAWGSTYGRVVGVHKIRFESPPRLHSDSELPSTKADVHTSAWADYAYEVNGKQFLGDALDWGSSKGEIIVIYYDPDHPARSALEMPDPIDPKITLTLSAIFFILGVFVGSGRSLPRFR